MCFSYNIYYIYENLSKSLLHVFYSCLFPSLALRKSYRNNSAYKIYFRRRKSSTVSTSAVLVSTFSTVVIRLSINH